MEKPQSLGAALEANEALKAENAKLQTDVSALNALSAEHSAVVAERDELKGKVTALSDKVVKMEGELQALKASAKSIEEAASAKAAEAVAALGIPPVVVNPKAEADQPSIHEQIAATKDPVERAKLRAKLLT